MNKLSHPTHFAKSRMLGKGKYSARNLKNMGALKNIEEMTCLYMLTVVLEYGHNWQPKIGFFF